MHTPISSNEAFDSTTCASVVCVFDGERESVCVCVCGFVVHWRELHLGERV
jgi:hypothetical protein